MSIWDGLRTCNTRIDYRLTSTCIYVTDPPESITSGKSSVVLRLGAAVP